MSLMADRRTFGEGAQEPLDLRFALDPLIYTRLLPLGRVVLQYRARGSGQGAACTLQRERVQIRRPGNAGYGCGVAVR